MRICQSPASSKLVNRCSAPSSPSSRTIASSAEDERKRNEAAPLLEAHSFGSGEACGSDALTQSAAERRTTSNKEREALMMGGEKGEREREGAAAAAVTRHPGHLSTI